MVLARFNKKVAKKPASARNADAEVEEDTDDGEASFVPSEGTVSGGEEPDRFAAALQKGQQAQGARASAWLGDNPKAMKGRPSKKGSANDSTEFADPPARELTKKEMLAAKKAEAKELKVQLKEHTKAKVTLKKASATLKVAVGKNKKAEAMAKGVCKKALAKLAKLAKLTAAAEKVRDAAQATASNAKDQLADAEWAVSTATMRVDELAPPKRAMKEKVAKAMKGAAMKKGMKGAKKPAMKATKVAKKAMKAKK